MSRRVRAERGAGTVLVLCVIMTVAVTLMAVAGLAAGYAVRHRAAAAADLAALAAAQQVCGGTGDPCALAARVAQANGAHLRDCVVDGWEVEVQVLVPAPPPGWLPDQLRRARAGPP